MQRLDSILGRVMEGAAVLAVAANEDQPHFWADGDVIRSAAGQEYDLTSAKALLHTINEFALSALSDGVSNRWQSMIPDLIAAIREAGQGETPPPAAMARAA
jgi:hypothetical protein